MLQRKLEITDGARVECPATRRDDVQHFHLVPQDASLRYAAQGCAEVLSCANRLVGQDLFTWTHLNGLRALADCPPQAPERRAGIVLIGGTEEAWRPDPEEMAMVRTRLLAAPRLCVVGAGVFVALAAGRSGGSSLSVHPNFRPAVVELAPGLELSNRVVSHSGGLSSAVSALTAVSMTLDLVARQLGGFTGQAVAEYLGLSVPQQSNRSVEHWRLVRKSQGDALIGRALAIMLDHLEEVKSVTQIADAMAVSPRHLERCFRDKLDSSPLRVYRDLRLERARQLLVQTGLPIREIALACGFGSTSVLTRWYNRRFGESPGRSRSGAFGTR